MDGSAEPFLFLIERAGIVEQDAPRRAIKVLKPVRVSDEDSSAALEPDVEFSVSFEIDFSEQLVRRQDISLSIDAETFKADLARARTFGFLDDVERAVGSPCSGGRTGGRPFGSFEATRRLNQKRS